MAIIVAILIPYLLHPRRIFTQNHSNLIKCYFDDIYNIELSTYYDNN